MLTFKNTDILRFRKGLKNVGENIIKKLNYNIMLKTQNDNKLKILLTKKIAFVKNLKELCSLEGQRNDW